MDRAREAEALRAAALAVSTAGGESVFAELVQVLARILGVPATMIGIFADGDRSRMRALATWLDGRLMRAFEYELAGTPCAGVVGREFRYVGQGAAAEFAPGTLFRSKGIDAYSAYSLNAPDGVQLGLIVAMDRKPLPESSLVEPLLKIFAVRAVAEIERVRAEAALKTSEASYRAIFEASEDSIFVHDWDSGAVLEANASACEMYGYSVAELRQTTVAQLSASEPAYSPARAKELLERAKSQAAPLRLEWRGRHRDGHLMWLEVTLKAAMLAGQRRLVAFVRDITERKAADEALAASEAQYRAIFNASADALILWDSSLRRVDVNPAYERIYGWRRDEVVGRAYEDRVNAPGYAQRRLDLVRRSLAGETCRVALEAVRKSGERFTAEVTTIPFTHRGEPHVLAIARDITERNRAEEALRASEEQYRAIYNATADALALRDAGFRIVDVNAAYEAMTGRRRADVIGEEGLTITDERERVDRRSLHARALAGEPVRIETEGRRPDGTPLVLEVRGVPVTHRGQPHVLYIGRDITARQQAEAALRASEEQYRAIFNATADALVLRDSAFRIVDVNAAYEAFSGRRRDEVLGLQDLTITRDSSATIERRTLHEEALAGKPLFFEADGQRPDGTPFVLEVRGVPMAYRGEPHVLYMGRDVTEAKRAERALRASEEQYRAIFNSAADGMVLRDADYRVVDVNAAYEPMSGLKREEMIGTTDALLHVDPERENARLAAHRRALAGKRLSTELDVERRDGYRFRMDLQAVPIQYRGAPHVLYVGRDITERKLAEQALRASEEQYRAIFNATADALVLRDAKFRIVDVNHAYEAMSGYSRDEVIGRDHLVANPSEREGETRALHARALAGETIMLETLRVRKDGSRAEVELRGVPIRHRGAPHVLYIGRDISERRVLESRLRQAQKMEALGQLTGGIAHDFNNLLASIMGYVVLAAERVGGADAKLAGYFEQSLASCRRARDLIAQMLTFSRGQRGELRALPLAAAVEQSIAMLRGTLPSTLELDTALAPAPAAMHDPVHIGQVVMNLLINARDATSGVGRVEVALRSTLLSAKAVCASCRKRFRGEFVELSVRDSGPGIAPAVVERIFEPFFTTKEVGRGSGMGLAMVHGIVHEHHGHIVVESAPSLGSCFRVLLPALASAPGEEARFSEKRRSNRRQPLKGRVLVVDDEAPVAEFMRELLESWGMSARTATDPLAVPEHVARDPRAYDLVILDQTMPGMTGLGLARELLALRPGLPILLYTGHSDRLSPPDLQAAGIRGLLHKPVEPDSLYGLLKAHLH